MSGGSARYVLLVDDHADGRELLEEFLSLSGFTVKSAESGEAALAVIATQGAPAIVVTDLSLGAMHGAELARQAKAAVPGVPVLAVTGHSGYEDPEKLFVGVLVKPVPLNALVDAVTRALG